jgi:hypothetical protein
MNTGPVEKMRGDMSSRKNSVGFKVQAESKVLYK